MIFRRARRRALLEDSLGNFWRERAPADHDALTARLASLLAELDVGWQVDPTTGWRLETPEGRFHAGLDPEAEQVSFLQFIEPSRPEVRGEGHAELLRANEASNGAHYCLKDLDAGMHLLVRSMVGRPALELGALALALESLLRKSERTLGPDEPPATGPSPTLVRVSDTRRRLDPGPSGLPAAAAAVEQALDELELDWHATPDRAHEWRIELDLGLFQTFLRPTGEALVVRMPVWEVREREKDDFWELLLELSGTRGAWFSVNEESTWVFVTAVVSAQTLNADALAFSFEEVLRHARDWIES